MTILISGASGFVGTNLCSYLNNLGYTIDVIDLGQSVPDYVRAAYQWNHLDAIYFNDYDAVIHLAGMAHDTKNRTSEGVYKDVNYGLTKRIFDKFVDSEAANFIFFSSVKAVADFVKGDYLTEDVVPQPVGPYGESKAMAEEYIQNIIKKEPNKFEYKRVYILRPCMIHGPGNKGNLNLLFKLVSMGIPWPLGCFNNSRSFTSIDNLLFVIDKLLKSNIESGVYNICDDKTISTNRLIELIAESQGRKSRIWKVKKKVIKALAALGDTFHLPLNRHRLQKLTENYIVSNNKIKKAIGVENLPVSAEDGIRKTLSSFKSHK